MQDSFFMQHALELADQPERSTSPNPRVGAVLVRDGIVVSKGYHAGPGFEHAEEVAIREAGDAARGATLYCTLEPCSHSGRGKRRPPCAPLIVRSGVRRVVIAQLDPNPRVRGNGKALLEDAGITVTVGLSADQAIELNSGFNTRMSLGRPFIHIKAAQSLDGRVAASDGSSRWITDAVAREHVHVQRGRHDAVLIGIGTALADDPLLNVRSGPPRQPRAVVLDSAAQLPLDGRLAATRAAETIVVVGPDAVESRILTLEREGVRVLRTRSSTEHGVNLDEALELLGAADILSLYVEGGRRVVSSLLEAGLFDQLTSFIAPVLIGGPNGGLEPPAAATMEAAMRLDRVRSEVIGDQAMISGYRPGWWESIHSTTGQANDRESREVSNVHRSC